MNGLLQTGMWNYSLRFPVHEGIHHITPDEKGKLIGQGLLTATMPTKIGGEQNVLARTMDFEFLRPVFTDDTIICKVKIEKYEKQENDRIAIIATFTYHNQNEKEVLKGSFSGVIFLEFTITLKRLGNKSSRFFLQLKKVSLIIREE